MRNGKYIVLLLVVLIISSTLVACSDRIEVHNMEDNTYSPSVEECKTWNGRYIVANGDMMGPPPESMEMPVDMAPPTDVPSE